MIKLGNIIITNKKELQEKADYIQKMYEGRMKYTPTARIRAYSDFQDKLIELYKNDIIGKKGIKEIIKQHNEYYNYVVDPNKFYNEVIRASKKV